MSDSLIRMLRRATTHIFEDLCFSSVDPGAHEAPDAWDVVSTVRFRGERSGALVLRLSNVDPSQLAEAMLGDAEELDEALALDAVGELTNVLCGNVLPDVAGCRATFDLSHPEVTRGIEQACEGLSTRVLVGVEDGLAEVELFFADEVPAFDSPPSNAPPRSEGLKSVAP